MPTFALPLAPSTTTTHSQPSTSRVRFSLPTRKRKRPLPTSPSASPSPENSDNESEDRNLPAGTNPLSLTPAELTQYKLAGLKLDEELPSVKAWPHRGLGWKYDLKAEKEKEHKKRKNRKGKGKELAMEETDEGESQKEEVEEPKKGSNRGPLLRVQHLGVLTTILQRCLMEGDIERAKRAWAMLIRGQFGGKGVDLRQSGYWGIGAELLMRSLDKPSKRPIYDSDTEDEDQEEESRNESGWRWGSKEGLEKTKDYYERLILQHPYKRQFHGSVNALDFWPAMLGCEIYGIQADQKETLRKLEKEEDDDDGAERSSSESDGSSDNEEEDDAADDGFAADQKRKDRRIQRRAERRWVQREEIRQATLAASGQIAVRLDDIMGTPPFADSHTLLRLRGMLALYIGDLSVPAKPIDVDEESDDDESFRRSQRLQNKDSGKRFFFRQRMNDHERGKKKQGEEQEKARKFFYRIKKSGGSLEDVNYLSLIEDQEELQDEE